MYQSVRGITAADRHSPKHCRQLSVLHSLQHRMMGLLTCNERERMRQEAVCRDLLPRGTEENMVSEIEDFLRSATSQFGIRNFRPADKARVVLFINSVCLFLLPSHLQVGLPHNQATTMFSASEFLCIFHFSHACDMSEPSLPRRFNMMMISLFLERDYPGK